MNKCGTCGRFASGMCLLMDCETAENKAACPEYIEGKRQTCGECKHLNKELAFCRACGAKWLNDSDGANCKYFEEVTAPTVFDRITANEETLAESVVYTYEMAIGGSVFKIYWTSPFVENFYPDKAEAIAATVARLKEVCDGN